MGQLRRLMRNWPKPLSSLEICRSQCRTATLASIVVVGIYLHKGCLAFALVRDLWFVFTNEKQKLIN